MPNPEFQIVYLDGQPFHFPADTSDDEIKSVLNREYLRSQAPSSESEMMADLAKADASGDTELAQHIAGRIKTARAAAKPSLASAVGRGAVQGAALGFADEMTGSYAAAQKQLEQHPELAGVPDAELYATAMGSPDDYTPVRDAYRAKDKAAREAHPWGYIGGQVVGGAPLALATGGAGGVLGTMATGAVLGGVGAAGESTADTAGGVARDAGIGAGLGGALGAVPAVAGKAISKLREALDSASISAGRRVLRNVGGSISAHEPVSDDAVREAFNSGAFKFGGTTKGTSARLDAVRTSLGEQKRQIMSALEAQGITGPDADALAQQYIAKGATEAATTMNPSVPRVYESAAEQIASKPTTNGRLGISQAEDLKASLQDQARSSYKQLDPRELGLAKETSASMLRQAVEDTMAKQAAASGNPATQALADQFVPLKQRLGNIIEASETAREGTARAANRHAFGLYDALAAVQGAGSGYAAHGAPGALIGGPTGAIASHVLRTRGPSTGAVSARFVADVLDVLNGPPTPGRQALQKLLDSMRAGAPIASEQAGMEAPHFLDQYTGANR